MAGRDAPSSPGDCEEEYVRKVVLTFWVSMDGYSALDEDFLAEYLEALEDDEQQRYFADRLASVGEHAMGTVTYRGMSETWPASDHPIAEPLNRLPKLVFTTGSGEVDTTWGPVRVIRGDTATAIAALKEEEGGDILVHGGLRFVHALLREGLIDELRLTILPVATGTGSPLFEDLGRLQPLQLVQARVFPSGVQEVVWRFTAL
jgi:dihydrofolate reductase